MASSQWPLELTVHELLLYPPNATEGRAPPALLGFSTKDVSRWSQARLFWTFLLFSSLFSVLCCAYHELFRCLIWLRFYVLDGKLNGKPGSTMV